MEPGQVRADPAGVGLMQRRHPLHRTAAISTTPPDVSRAWHRRALRRCLRWCLRPVTDAVTRHNRAVADVVETQRRELALMRVEAERLGNDLSLMRRGT